jgi:hypothetical protein
MIHIKHVGSNIILSFIPDVGTCIELRPLLSFVPVPSPSTRRYMYLIFDQDAFIPYPFQFAIYCLPTSCHCTVRVTDVRPVTARVPSLSATVNWLYSQTSAPAYAGLPATVKWGTVHEWLGAGKKYHVLATNVHCSQQQHFENEVVIRKKKIRKFLNRPSPANKRLHYWQWKHNFWKTMHSSVFCYMYFAIIREILQQHTWQIPRLRLSLHS